MDINHTIDSGVHSLVAAKPRATGNMSTKKLSDTALVLLNAAANRDNGMRLPVPDGLEARGSALSALLSSRLSRGFVEQVAVKTEVESWRRDESSTWIGLAATPAGLTAIGIEPISDSGDAVTTLGDAHIEKPQRQPSKQDQIIAPLSREEGATIEVLMSATGPTTAGPSRGTCRVAERSRDCLGRRDFSLPN